MSDGAWDAVYSANHIETGVRNRLVITASDGSRSVGRLAHMLPVWEMMSLPAGFFVREVVHIFSYNKYEIISAAPIAEIKEYLNQLGGVETPEQAYEYAGLKIEITPYTSATLPNLNIERHAINVSGDKAPAEQFLTAFRFRFLSAGG